MKYFIVRKLNNGKADVVNAIIARLEHIFNAFGDEIVENVEDSDLTIVIGGDGTALYALRATAGLNIPVICFNIGKLGFLAEFSPDNIEEVIINTKVSSTYKHDFRTMVYSEELNISAINEFVIAPKSTSDTLQYEFFIDGVCSSALRSNGLIISTPTGSTSYSLSVGGSILQPDAGVLQITPISPMSLNARSLVVNDSSLIEVIVRPQGKEQYCIIADGRSHDIISEYRNFHKLTFKKSPHKTILQHHKDWNFFKVLQEKLHWNTVI